MKLGRESVVVVPPTGSQCELALGVWALRSSTRDPVLVSPREVARCRAETRSRWRISPLTRIGGLRAGVGRPPGAIGLFLWPIRTKSWVSPLREAEGAHASWEDGHGETSLREWT